MTQTVVCHSSLRSLKPSAASENGWNWSQVQYRYENGTTAHSDDWRVYYLTARQTEKHNLKTQQADKQIFIQRVMFGPVRCEELLWADAYRMLSAGLLIFISQPWSITQTHSPTHANICTELNKPKKSPPSLQVLFPEREKRKSWLLFKQYKWSKHGFRASRIIIMDCAGWPCREVYPGIIKQF